MTAIYFISAYLTGILLFINERKIFNNILLIFFVILQWTFTIFSYYNIDSISFDYFTFDSLGVLLLLVLSTISIPILIHSYIYVETHNETPHSRGVFYAALVTLITSISAAYLANNIAVIWIFTELTTLSASVLIYHHRNKLALEGTWKYIFICAISVTFVFIGILFLSFSIQDSSGTNELSFTNLMAKGEHLNTFWLRLAFLFVFTGFTAKIGLVPMYTAGVDAKDNAPSPVGALLSTALVNMGFVGIFRFYAVVTHTQLHNWANIVIFSAAVLSIFIATIYMTKVINIKRMFAYSGIEHMGLVMLGLAAGGIGYYAAILHIVLHSFVKSSLFLQFNQLYRVFQSKMISNVGNYFKYNATGALVLLIGYISATAMPPSGMFVSEFLIFRSLFESRYIGILVVVLLFLTINIWAFGKRMFKIIYTPVVGFDDSRVPMPRKWESLTQYILLAVAVWLGLNPPDFFVQLIQNAITILPK